MTVAPLLLYQSFLKPAITLIPINGNGFFILHQHLCDASAEHVFLLLSTKTISVMAVAPLLLYLSFSKNEQVHQGL